MAKPVTGTIKFFKAQHGYGFISRDDGGRDVFLHSEQLRASGILWVDVGARLKFDVTEDGGKGPRATNVEALR